MIGARAPRTVSVANGIASDQAFGAVTPPIYLSTTVAFAGFEQPRQYDYSRLGNPTRALLADTIAKLEGGAGAIVLSSGMAAVDLVLSTLGPGDLLVAPHDCYGGTHRLISARSEKGQFRAAFIDQGDEAALASALCLSPALILVETPSNPLMRIVDIAALCARAEAVGAKVAVDNTFLSPALQRPIGLGADFVIHSTTKYLNGHSDVIGGVLVTAAREDLDELTSWANTVGVTGSAFDAYLTLRGVRTLFPRVESQQASAQRIAEHLHRHDKVRDVYYPGLPSHPGHEIAAAQQAGFGAMLSFTLTGGVEAVRRFANALRLFTLAESLGGIESLVAHPATMTHAAMYPQARRTAGIGDDLLRLSIGLEAVDDLLADLDQALSAAG